ncbi:MAG TPA: MFS transporter [Jatrophihabitans sp.]|jgi:EmrB/QacA subfamily drug resistance transporter|uniref:MFS transporter n=1 Tax=Jatrophihabitans sp. TaxID=1932789 RepID=UPI002E09238F|nr:MFS transporter [Jatrophihabitans sp.]
MTSTGSHATTAQPPETETARRPWTVLALALAAQVLVVLDISVVNTALPTIGRALDLPGSGLQWLITAYLLTSGGGLLLGGRIADVFARKQVFLTGVAIFTTASMTSGLAANAGTLIGSRAGQGLGAALMTPAALSLIMTGYAGAQRARGLALWGAVGSMGIAAGVLLGGALTTWFGWRAIFWINVPVGIAVLVIGTIVLPATRVERTAAAQLDVPGGVTVVAGLGALVYGIESITSHGVTSPITVGAFAVAVALLTAFSRIERRSISPLVPPHAWRIRSLVAGTATIAGVTAVLVGAIFLISIFCQTVLGYSALRTGVALVPLALALTGGTHVARHLLAKTSARHVASGGLVVAAIGAVLLAQGTTHPGYLAGVLPGLVVLGIGSGLVFVAVFISASAGIPAQHAGTASGLVMTGHEIGAALGVAILAAVAAGAGPLSTVAGATAGAGRGFAAAAALAVVVAAIAAMTMPKSAGAGAAAGHMHMH